MLSHASVQDNFNNMMSAKFLAAWPVTTALTHLVWPQTPTPSGGELPCQLTSITAVPPPHWQRSRSPPYLQSAGLSSIQQAAASACGMWWLKAVLDHINSESTSSRVQLLAERQPEIS